nr:hypothetical protein [uncultured Acetatifactor sp.]
MKEMKNLKKELSKIDDMVDIVELKVHNLIGLLELVYLGIRELNKVDDSFELSSVNVVQEYLETIEKTDIQELHEKLTKLKERV